MTTLHFTVPGMTCGHCTSAVETELIKIDGVTGVSIDLDTKSVEVSGEGIDWPAVEDAVDEAGFELVR